MANKTNANANAKAPDTLVNNQDGKNYWETVDADVNGMLGGIPATEGFGATSRIDLQGSRTFLAKLGIGTKQGRKPVKHALEGGAGIGRITEGLLLNLAEKVDIIEPVTKFTDVLQGKAGVERIFNVGLEEWEPALDVEYELVWTQWCLNYLSNDQVVRYLERCKSVLKPGIGIIVIKENLNTSAEDVFDDMDSSVTRQDETFRSLFSKAGLKVIKSELQRGMPETDTKVLYPVRMYALRP